jgi:hypothetical protein
MGVEAIDTIPVLARTRTDALKADSSAPLT